MNWAKLITGVLQIAGGGALVAVGVAISFSGLGVVLGVPIAIGGAAMVANGIRQYGSAMREAANGPYETEYQRERRIEARIVDRLERQARERQNPQPTPGIEPRRTSPERSEPRRTSPERTGKVVIGSGRASPSNSSSTMYGSGNSSGRHNAKGKTSPSNERAPLIPKSRPRSGSV